MRSATVAPAAAASADEVVDQVAAGRVEAGVGLVEQPQLRAAGDEDREGGAAALPGRQPGDGDLARRPLRPSCSIASSAICGTSARGAGPEAHVVGDGQVVVERCGVAEEPDPRRGPTGGRARGRGRARRPRPTEIGKARRRDAAAWSCRHRSAPGPGRSRRGATSRSTPASAGKRPSSATAARRWTTESMRPAHRSCGGAKATMRGLGTLPSWTSTAAASTSTPQPQLRPIRWRRRAQRPEAPRRPRSRDWRWVVGGIGRVLIAAGVLILLFVAYQLWGTGIQEARAQNKLENEFESIIATTPAPTTTRATTTRPSSASSTAPTTTVAPAAVPPPVVEPGDPLARIEIPKIGVDKIVVAGVGVVGPAQGARALSADAAARAGRQRRDRRPPHDLRRPVLPRRRARCWATRSS